MLFLDLLLKTKRTFLEILKISAISNKATTVTIASVHAPKDFVCTSGKLLYNWNSNLHLVQLGTSIQLHLCHCLQTVISISSCQCTVGTDVIQGHVHTGDRRARYTHASLNRWHSDSYFNRKKHLQSHDWPARVCFQGGQGPKKMSPPAFQIQQQQKKESKKKKKETHTRTRTQLEMWPIQSRLSSRAWAVYVKRWILTRLGGGDERLFE